MSIRGLGLILILPILTLSILYNIKISKKSKKWKFIIPEIFYNQ